MSQTENNETDEMERNGPVRISVAIYTDSSDGSDHILLEARQGSFLMQHFMNAEDARKIGIALSDAANEVELEDAYRNHEIMTMAPHEYLPLVNGGQCSLCGMPQHNVAHV